MIDSAPLRLKLEEGRAAHVAGLRALADDIDTLPLDGAAEALSWIADDGVLLLHQPEHSKHFKQDTTADGQSGEHDHPAMDGNQPPSLTGSRNRRVALLDDEPN
jgi:hypothetical protein